MLDYSQGQSAGFAHNIQKVTQKKTWQISKSQRPSSDTDYEG